MGFSCIQVSSRLSFVWHSATRPHTACGDFLQPSTSETGSMAFSDSQEHWPSPGEVMSSRADRLGEVLTRRSSIDCFVLHARWRLLGFAAAGAKTKSC